MARCDTVAAVLFLPATAAGAWHRPVPSPPPSLLLDRGLDEVIMKRDDDTPSVAAGTATKKGLSRVKTWPKNITNRNLKTPTSTPPHEPEVIDGCEIMAGLENATPLNLRRATCFSNYPRPSSEESVCGRKQPSSEVGGGDPSATGIVEVRVKEFQRKIDQKEIGRRCRLQCQSKTNPARRRGEGGAQLHQPPWRGADFRRQLGGQDDPQGLRSPRGRVRSVAARDVQGGALGRWCGPPKVYENGNYLGGAEEPRHMHEAGKLGKVLEGCERLAVAEKAGCGGACEGCGDVRFIPCVTCSGNCKVYCDSAVVEEAEAGFGGVRKCPGCNGNGLFRSPLCSC